MSLRGTLEKLNLAFGAMAARATLVLATKADRLSQQQLQVRLRSIRQVVAEQHLQGVLVWQNEGLDDAGFDGQVNALRTAANHFCGVATTDLVDLHRRQRLKAQELCDAHPTQTRTIEVEVDEEYTVPRHEQEPYEEHYIENESFTENYQDTEIYQEPETHMRTVVKKMRGYPGAFFGQTKECDEPFTVMVQKVRQVTKQRPATRPVPNTRTAYRTVTKYDSRKRKKTVPKVVECRLEIDRFMDEALRVVVDEVRQSLSR